MASRAESKIIRALKLAVRHRDGNLCFWCKAEGIEFSDEGFQHKDQSSNEKSARKKLDLHHIDGKSNNNSMSNLRLYCRSCNQKDRVASNPPKEQSSFNGVRARKNVSPTEQVKRNLDYQDGSVEMKANDNFEIEFRHWLEAKLRSNPQHRILMKEAIYGGAERCGANPTTTRRYLNKMTSEEGSLKEVKDEFKHKIIVFRHLEASDIYDISSENKAILSNNDPYIMDQET